MNYGVSQPSRASIVYGYGSGVTLWHNNDFSHETGRKGPRQVGVEALYVGEILG